MQTPGAFVWYHPTPTIIARACVVCSAFSWAIRDSMLARRTAFTSRRIRDAWTKRKRRVQTILLRHWRAERWKNARGLNLATRR